MSNDKLDLLKGEEKLLLDHNYDGIHELDHMLPRWWVWLFFSTVAFGVVYAAYYMGGYGPSLSQELKISMSELESLKPKVQEPNAEDQALLLAAIHDPESQRRGAAIFQGKCAVCHGDKAQGVIGPNLTDDYWINGNGGAKDISQIIAKGVVEKGMPPWGEILNPQELRDVASFVRSTAGTNPINAKAPQGEKVIAKD